MNKPTHQFKAGLIIVTVWQNFKKDGEGNVVSFNTVNCQRNYRTKNGWKITSTLRLGDLPKAAMLLNRAYEELILQKNNKNYEKTNVMFKRRELEV